MFLLNVMSKSDFLFFQCYSLRGIANIESILILENYCNDLLTDTVLRSAGVCEYATHCYLARVVQHFCFFSL